MDTLVPSRGVLAPALPRWADGLSGWLLPALGFFLPFSVAGTSLTLAALLLLAVATAPTLWRVAPWREPVMALGIALFALIAIRTVVDQGFTGEAWQVVRRYRELLFAPVLLAIFRLSTRREHFLTGLALGYLAYALVHWASLALPELARTLEPRRISAGFGFAVAAFVLFRHPPPWGRPAAWTAAAAFLALTVPFAVGGRTGYLVLLLLAGCAAWLHAPPRWRWAAVIGLPLLVVVLASQSTAVKTRLQETMAGTQPLADGSLTATGIRIELLRNGLELARRHWLTGAGYGSYAQLHEASARRLYGGDPARRHYLSQFWVRTGNPHSEYLMQLVGGGVVALGLLLAWLAVPVIRAHRGPPAAVTLAGVTLAFALACLFNSLLMDVVEGHLYMGLLTFLLARAGQSHVEGGSA